MLCLVGVSRRHYTCLPPLQRVIQVTAKPAVGASSPFEAIPSAYAVQATATTIVIEHHREERRGEERERNPRGRKDKRKKKMEKRKKKKENKNKCVTWTIMIGGFFNFLKLQISPNLLEIQNRLHFLDFLCILILRILHFDPKLF